MTGNIEFVEGKEQHSSFWGKYYVKGLEPYQVEEDFDQNIRDAHHSYQGYVCNDVPEGTIFTIFEQNGDKHGTDVMYFSIWEVTAEAVHRDPAQYGRGFCTGNMRRLLLADTKLKASRLMDWWDKKPSDPARLRAFVDHCATYIVKRGVKELPPFDPPEAISEVEPNFPNINDRIRCLSFSADEVVVLNNILLRMSKEEMLSLLEDF